MPTSMDEPGQGIPRKLIRLKAAARLCGLSARHGRERLREVLPTYQPGGRANSPLCVDQRDLERFIESCRREPAPAASGIQR